MSQSQVTLVFALGLLCSMPKAMKADLPAVQNTAGVIEPVGSAIDAGSPADAKPAADPIDTRRRIPTPIEFELTGLVALGAVGLLLGSSPKRKS